MTLAILYFNPYTVAGLRGDGKVTLQNKMPRSFSYGVYKIATNYYYTEKIKEKINGVSEILYLHKYNAPSNLMRPLILKI